MALDYVFKIIIMMVVVAVVIGLILTFKNQITTTIAKFLSNLWGGNTGNQFPQLIDKGSGTFSSGEVATYIQSCYSVVSSTEVAERKTTDCYILKGNFNVDKNSIISSVTDPTLRSKIIFTADFTKGVAVVEYEDPEDVIFVK